MINSKSSYVVNSIVLVLFVVLIWAGISVNRSIQTQQTITAKNSTDTAIKPINIILMIGDGMGLSQISGGYFSNSMSLNLTQFKNIGLVKTTSSSHLITDSAAGATAFATGKKTSNGMLSMDADTNSIPTILEYCQQKDISTGLVVTCAITHATPAAFYGHQNNRYGVDENLIQQLTNHNITVIMGGGLKYFNARTDSINYLDSMISKGYTILDSSSYASANYNNINKLLCLVAANHLPKMSEGRGSYLPESTEHAISILSKNPNGFFLMVEGSQIDWGGHNNDGDYITSEVIDFDNAVGKALDFAEKDGNTLVIVTADHETGGYSIIGGSLNNTKITAGFSTIGHTCTMVPIFTYGPNENEFSGWIDNTDVFFNMISTFEKSDN